MGPARRCGPSNRSRYVKRLLALAIAALILPAVPAHADHEVSWWGHPSPRLVYFEDRSGNPEFRSYVATAADLWNQSGAPITIVYRDGPVSRSCGKASYGVIRFCLTPAKKGWPSSSFGADNPVNGHYASGIVEVREDRLGLFGPLHEAGHALGLGHSLEYSVMNLSANGLHASVPTEHDYEALRALYDHTDLPA